jgi:hypothetical protein
MMVGEADNKDKNESRSIAIVLISLVIVLGVGILLMLPMAADFVAVHFSPGLGLKASAVIAFFITIAVIVVFAVAAGDGLLGELQFILSGFFLFFVIIWLLLAWIF